MSSQIMSNPENKSQEEKEVQKAETEPQIAHTGVSGLIHISRTHQEIGSLL